MKDVLWKKFLTVGILILFVVFCTETMAAEEKIEVEGQLLAIDYSRLDLQLIIFSGTKKRDRTFPMGFKKTEKGCIDWQEKKNRQLSSFFQIEPGDYIALTVEKDTISSLKIISEEIKHELRESNKIKSEALLDKLFLPGEMVDVIITLAAIKDGMSVDEVVEKLVSMSGESNFKLIEKTENLPIISARINLRGLLKIVKNEYVNTIEENIEITFN